MSTANVVAPGLALILLVGPMLVSTILIGYLPGNGYDRDIYSVCSRKTHSQQTGSFMGVA